MAFKENDLVEVRIRGFLTSGISYYAATILEKMPNNRYLVQYYTRLKPDGTRFMEPVAPDDIRPLCPTPPIRDFDVSDRVEAFVLQAWRVGTVTGKDGLIYHVKLDGSASHYHCANFELRPHLEWDNGTWFSSGSGSQSNQASTSAQGDQPGNQASTTSLQGDQPDNQASTSPQWDQPEDGSDAKRRRLE